MITGKFSTGRLLCLLCVFNIVFAIFSPVKGDKELNKYDVYPYGLSFGSAPAGVSQFSEGAHPLVSRSLEHGIYSPDLNFFTKWQEAVARHDYIRKAYGSPWPSAWQKSLAVFEGLSFEDRLRGVNALINNQAFITDEEGWQHPDYWAAPAEFFLRGGGDCEDFAVAKYFALLALGVPETRLRIGVVEDLRRAENHALLFVDVRGLRDISAHEAGFVVLDNQNTDILSWQDLSYYRPLYSINRQGWWNHTFPAASSEIYAADTASYKQLVDKKQ